MTAVYSLGEGIASGTRKPRRPRTKHPRPTPVTEPLIGLQSEVELQAKLNLARDVCRATDTAKQRRAPFGRISWVNWDAGCIETCVRHGPHGRICGVKHLRPELESLTFGNRKLFEDRKVEIFIPIRPQGVAA